MNNKETIFVLGPEYLKSRPSFDLSRRPSRGTVNLYSATSGFYNSVNQLKDVDLPRPPSSDSTPQTERPYDDRGKCCYSDIGHSTRVPFLQIRLSHRLRIRYDTRLTNTEEF